MKKSKKATFVWAIETAMTTVVLSFSDVDAGWIRLLPVTWLFFSWNFLAYAVDRDMWPWIFIELEGRGKGHPPAREAMFWISAILYVGILTMVAWASR